MFVHERSSAQLGRSISLATIDEVVAARLGETRVGGNAQPAVFNRQIAMYLTRTGLPPVRRTRLSGRTISGFYLTENRASRYA
jgi:hypothetical protein